MSGLRWAAGKRAIREPNYSKCNFMKLRGLGEFAECSRSICVSGFTGGCP